MPLMKENAIAQQRVFRYLIILCSCLTNHSCGRCFDHDNALSLVVSQQFDGVSTSQKSFYLFIYILSICQAKQLLHAFPLDTRVKDGCKLKLCLITFNNC